MYHNEQFSRTGQEYQKTMAHQTVHIHPTADVSAEAVIGEGTRIWHQAQVRERATIGRNCIVGKGVYVDFDVTIGHNCKLQNGTYVYHPAVVEDGVFLGPGVIITNDLRPRAVNPDLTLKSEDDWTVSRVWIGQGASVGAGSIVLPGVSIGCWAMVGAGAVVIRDVPEQGLVVGNPARLIGYVCRCSARLVEASPGDFTCPDCSEQYQIGSASQ